MTVFTWTNIVSKQVSAAQCKLTPLWGQILSIEPLTAPRGSASYFLLPIRAISSALAAALVLMSWFLARSMRTLRMLVGTSRDRAKRDPCWALFGTWEAGRSARARRSTAWCSDRSNEFNIALWFSMLTASTSLCVSSSSLARAGLLWLWTHQGSSRARQKQTRTLLMVGTVCKHRRRTKLCNCDTARLLLVMTSSGNFPLYFCHLARLVM